MRDFDELLTGGVAEAAADAVDRAPDLAELRHRGARRRRIRRTALAGLAAAAVVAVIGLAQLPGSDHAAPPDPAPRPTPSPSPDRPDRPKGDGQKSPAKLTPEEVVDDPRAKLLLASVSKTDPDVRATVWQVCNKEVHCTEEAVATALTDDGYRTRTVVRGSNYGELVPLGDRGFLFTEEFDTDDPTLLTSDGRRAPIEIDDGPPRPFVDGEVLWGVPGSGEAYASWLGIDPVTGIAHRVPVPEPLGAEHVTVRPGGRLAMVRNGDDPGAATVHWSDDGGASWETHVLPARAPAEYTLVPSAQPSTLMAIEVGAGSTSPTRLTTTWVSRDDGETWKRVGGDLISVASPMIVLPDGRLLALTSSQVFYAGSDVRDLAPVTMGAPFTAEQTQGRPLSGPQKLVVHADAEGVTIYGKRRGELFRTTDNGATWEEVATR